WVDACHHGSWAFGLRSRKKVQSPKSKFQGPEIKAQRSKSSAQPPGSSLKSQKTGHTRHRIRRGPFIHVHPCARAVDDSQLARLSCLSTARARAWRDARRICAAWVQPLAAHVARRSELHSTVSLVARYRPNRHR